MTNKRKSRELTVPDISEDPAERKRMLNVLAQRRYRRRKRERLESLQAQVEGKSRSSETTSEASSQSHDDGQSSAASQSPAEINVQHHWENGVSEPLPEPELTSTTPVISSQMSVMPDMWSPLQLFSLLSPSLSPQMFQDSISPPDDSFSGLSPPAMLLEPFTQNQQDSEDQNPCSLERYGITRSLSDQLQTHQSSTYTFADDQLLDIPCLSLMNAAMRIAVRLNIKDTLWDITAISPFYQGPGQNSLAAFTPESAISPSSSTGIPSPGAHQTTDLLDVDSLPPHFRPTPSQRRIPHHPVLDLLPWPNVRDKLIQVFTLPVALRPKVAQDPMGVFRFVYDMEDESGEGLRFGGPDPFDLNSSEIGQVVFERWWWAFDGAVVEHSNRARRKRGQKGLSLGVAAQADT